jgi:lipopolysaccharide export system protein LptC
MAFADHAQQGHYSRIVGILKVVLPLTALVLLSLVFLLARTVDPTRAISSAEIDVEDRARDPRLSGAHFAGVTDDGAALTIVAQTARSDPDAAMRLEVSGLELQLDGAQGERLNASASAGIIDRGRGTFSLEGGLSLDVTPGYRLTTERLSGLLDSTRISAPGVIAGSAPAGQIEAGTMVLQVDSTDGVGYLLVFGGGVRLNYQPSN